MKILGIVAEYNPFHNGHLYQLQEAKRQIHPDFCIAVMSGCFLQRGEAALFDKYTRCRMALASGLDAIYELPAYYACSSAEEFAAAAVLTMQHLSVTHLAFGAECDDLDLLTSLAQVSIAESAFFTATLNNAISRGATYAKAYSEALCACSNTPDAEEILKQPNNMLALCYLRAILRFCPEITPVLIPRRYAMYHDTEISGSIASASAIRRQLSSCETADLSQVIPDTAQAYLPFSANRIQHLTNEDLTDYLSYALLSGADKDLSVIYDISGDLSNRIHKQPAMLSSYSALVHALKTKQYTYTRISRALLHLLLDFRQDIFLAAKQEQYIFYVRLLGFARESASLIRYQKTHCRVVYIQKVSDGEAALKTSDETAQTLLQADFRAAECYRMAWYKKYHEVLASDYTQNAIILS